MLNTIILASESPRRAQLLEQIGIDFEVLPSEFDESSIRIENPKDFVKTLALKKAESIPCHQNERRLILAADTVVVIDGMILGKPHTVNDAEKYLKLLSGRTHQVYTGVAIRNPINEQILVDYCITEVRMDQLSAQDIGFYISTKEPFDKAGGYGIQGVGARYIIGIQGDFYNVMGLPLNLTIHMLKKMGETDERYT